MSTEPKIWERQKGENDRQWASFCAYRDQTGGRSVVDVYRTVYGRPKAKTPAGWFNSWPAKFDWKARTLAYDNYLTAIEINERQLILREKALEWAEKEQTTRARIFDIAEKMIERADGILSTPLHKKQVVDGPDGVEYHFYPSEKWRLGDARGLVVDAQKILRLMADMPTDIIDHKYEIDWDSLTDDQVARIEAGDDPLDVAPGHVSVH